MAPQENLSFPGSHLPKTRGVPTLVEVTNQIAAHDEQHGSVKLPPSPQVVFVTSEPVVEANEVDRPMVVVTQPEVSFAASAEPSPAFEASITSEAPADELVTDEAPANHPAEMVDGFHESIVVGDPMTGAWRHQWFYAEEPKFLLDPFDQAVDGPIPVLPVLPIVKAIEMTEKVVAREQKGVRYAWRLKPGPYPDLGNMLQVENGPNQDFEIVPQESAEIANVGSVVTEPEPESLIALEALGKSLANNEDQQAWSSAIENATPQEDWQQAEVIAEGDENQYGDDFYAQPGDVISIDGNQGYDHIDLRSYFLEDATFQPGSILLNPQGDSENGEAQPPIIIRHRGIDSAIFHGDVRVQL